MKRFSTTSLNGTWRFRLDRENLGEHFKQQLDLAWDFDARWMGSDYQDGEWSTIPVPSCWQEHGCDFNGAAWYRRRFSSPPTAHSAVRTWLSFSGVDYFADVWLNDHYLGSHEGYFAAFQYEIGDLLRPTDNLLALRVDSPNDVCAKESQPGQLKRLLKGALQRWDVNNPEVNPGGIWNDVTLYTTGPAAVERLAIETVIPQLPPAGHPDQPVAAELHLDLGLAGFRHPAKTAEARIQLTHAGQPVAAAKTEIPILTQPWSSAIRLDLEQVHLWYSWDLGTPHLYQLDVQVFVDDVLSDHVQQTFGFRKIERRRGWETYLNGLRLYQRGANYLSDQFLSSMTAPRYAQDAALLVEANLNTVHPFAVVEKQEFYEACDRHGLLVYQDFPMWLTMENSADLVRRAQVQLDELIRQFGHHPSIIIWNFGSQPSVANFLKLGAALLRRAKQLDPGRIAHQANMLLAAPHRPPDPVADYKWDLPTLEDFRQRYDWRIDTHNYRGWYSHDLAGSKTYPLELTELITEYGAQALPDLEMLAEFIDADDLFPPAMSRYTRRCFQPEYQFMHIALPQSLEQFIEDSQQYQAQFIQSHTEFYRRHQFAPSNGAHYFCFNDCWPAITWSVVDYRRRPKPGYFALQRAMAPLQAMLDLDWELQTIRKIDAPIWVINDLPQAFEQLSVGWQIFDPQGEMVASGSCTGSVPGSGKAQIGRLTSRLEQVAAAVIHLQLFVADAKRAENCYQLFQGNSIHTSPENDPDQRSSITSKNEKED